MPQVQKNRTSSVVYWFYKQYFGVAPDASIYARYQNKKNPKSLVFLLERDKDTESTIYEPEDVASLIYYLEDCGVNITNLNVVTIPGLMFNFMNRKRSDAAAQELQSTVDYLTGNNAIGESKQEFKAPSGWGN
jgi:hypothetical protein